MRTCLVVDDSRVVRKVAGRIVTDLGFNAVEAEDGVVALDKCRKSMPEAILLDWNMPNMSGIEFIIALRKEPNGDKPKVVFCTTESDMEFIQRALAEGADEYIMKPFDSDIVETKFVQVGLING
jgi:two-component system chemotaxis response regulator CheY